MQTTVKFSPSFAMAQVTLDPNEVVKAEAGAMVSMQGVAIETSTQGGFMKGLKRSVLGGESFFMNTFTASPQGGQVSFAPDLPGDVVVWELSGQTVYLQSGSYLASAMGIDVDSGWGGAKTFFSSEGLFILKCSGTGTLIISAYGAMDARQLQAGETVTIDSGHVVGWSDGITYQVRKVGNWKSTFLSGEGLVADLTGPGTVYLQTRSADAFLGWLIPKLPKSSN